MVAVSHVLKVSLLLHLFQQILLFCKSDPRYTRCRFIVLIHRYSRPDECLTGCCRRIRLTDCFQLHGYIH